MPFWTRSRLASPTAGRYGLSAIGPIAVSGAHFVASLIFLHNLPPAQFGLFSFLLVVVPFASASRRAFSARRCSRRSEGRMRWPAPSAPPSARSTGSIAPSQASRPRADVFAARRRMTLRAAAGPLRRGDDLPLVLALQRLQFRSSDARGGVGPGLQRGADRRDFSCCCSADICRFDARATCCWRARCSACCRSAGRSCASRIAQAARGRASRSTAPIWRDLTRWSLLGVVLTEMTVNAHAYLVTFISGTQAFALLAVGSLLMRPLSLVLSALPDLERPAIAPSPAKGDHQGRAAHHASNSARPRPRCGSAPWRCRRRS